MEGRTQANRLFDKELSFDVPRLEAKKGRLFARPYPVGMSLNRLLRRYHSNVLARERKPLDKIGRKSKKRRDYTYLCVRKLLRDFDGPFSASATEVENPSR